MVNLYKVRDLTKEKGWSLSYVCSKMGVAASYFTDVKNGKLKISPERLNQIAEILDTTPEYLTDKSDIASGATSKPLVDELPEVYLNLAKSAHVRNIDPMDIELILNTLEQMRNKEKSKNNGDKKN